MGNITVTRYAQPGTGWQGYIEPAGRSWIVFVYDDGHPAAFLNRDPRTGAVLQVPGCPPVTGGHLKVTG